MSEGVTEGQEALRKHVLASRHYLENAVETLKRQDAAKAGELLWCSLAQALQAVAAYRNLSRLSNHRSLRWFASTLARELDDRTLIDGFVHGERLHSNFHEVDLDTEDVALAVEPIRATVYKLFPLIPAELIRQPSPSEESVT